MTASPKVTAPLCCFTEHTRPLTYSQRGFNALISPAWQVWYCGPASPSVCCLWLSSRRSSFEKTPHRQRTTKKEEKKETPSPVFARRQGYPSSPAFGSSNEQREIEGGIDPSIRVHTKASAACIRAQRIILHTPACRTPAKALTFLRQPTTKTNKPSFSLPSRPLLIFLLFPSLPPPPFPSFLTPPLRQPNHQPLHQYTRASVAKGRRDRG